MALPIPLLLQLLRAQVASPAAWGCMPLSPCSVAGWCCSYLLCVQLTKGGGVTGNLLGTDRASCTAAEMETPAQNVAPRVWGTGVPRPLLPQFVTNDLSCVLCLSVHSLSHYIFTWVSFKFLFKYSVVSWDQSWFCFWKWRVKRLHLCVSWLIVKQMIFESHLLSFTKLQTWRISL